MYVEYLEGKKHGTANSQISDNHEAFKDCGYKLTPGDLVVDIDKVDKDVIQKLIQWFNIKTQVVWTNRGAHLYFKKPATFKGNQCICLLGFEIEYKHQSNTESVTIKQNGVLREIENEGIREDLPEIFKLRRKFTSLVGMSEGDGRNNALIQHRLKLGSMDNVQNILRFINSYVFADPMDENEMGDILRDLKLEAKKNNEFELASYIIDKYKTINYIDTVYWKDGGEYVSNDRKFRQILFEEFPGTTTRFIEEISKQVQQRSKLYDGERTYDIKLNNGILRRGTFIPVEFKDFTPYCIDLDYKPDGPDVPEVMAYIDHLTGGDEEYSDLLFEVLGHTLVVDKEFKRALAKFFIFVGDGGNGKGTLLTIIREILGTKNCSSLDIGSMTDERYLVNLKGKLANLGDDIQDTPIDHQQMKILKNISTCDYMPTRELYKQAQDVELTASLIFTSNHILKSFEKGTSYKRRVLWLPMYSEVKRIDPLFISKMTSPEALECWIKHIVEGYMRLYEYGRFSTSERVQTFNQDYHLENNNVLGYVDDLEEDDIIGKRSKEVHDAYREWAEENGLTVCSQKAMKEAIQRKFKAIVKDKKVAGRTNKVFVKETESLH